MEPLVSVIVPIFNHSSYIEECLNSIKSSDYSNLELLLCDDGSQDNSLDVVKAWIEKNPNVNTKLYTQKNQGVCKTLNRLILESSGEFIVVCASDDSLNTSGITERYKYLEDNTEKLAVIGDAFIINDESEVVGSSAMKELYSANYDNLKHNIIRELVLRWSVVGPTLMIRKSAYDMIGLYDESLAIEDREFYLRLLKNNNLAFIPINVANYRVHNKNVSMQGFEKRLKISEQVALSNLKHQSDFDVFNRIFLKSHIIDLFFIKLGYSRATFYCLFLFRGVRRLLFTPLRYIKSTK